MKKHRLIQIDWPEFGSCERPKGPSLEEFFERISRARAAMEARGLSHLVVYGDREHFANILYLSGMDPRFEEAVLILSLDAKPLILVGNECESYLAISPLYTAGEMRHERYQPLSLLDQPRNETRRIEEILADEGIGAGSKVGCAGWKYFTAEEHPDAEHQIEIPAYMVDALRALAGHDAVVNATDLLMHPGHGLRSTCSVAEIAWFEYAGILATEGLKSILHGVRDGMLDTELARCMDYDGEPLCCHMTLVSGDSRTYGLSGPIGATIRRGDPLASNVGYWGSNTCRAGWVAQSADDLPADARDYITAFAGVYFEVMNEWFRLLRVGMPGGEIYRLIEQNLPFEKFGIFLNPGHLIHMDEWVSSPIAPGSELPIRSGMAMQADVIPSSPTYFSTRMEDGVVIADETLRAELKTAQPECYARCQARRDFMINTVGIDVGEEILPLSNMPAIVPPFFLDPHTVFALEA